MHFLENGFRYAEDDVTALESSFRRTNLEHAGYVAEYLADRILG